MTKSSSKHDTKSKSHPGMKLTPVGVSSCKHPLNTVHSRLYNKLKDMLHIESNIEKYILRVLEELNKVIYLHQ